MTRNRRHWIFALALAALTMAGWGARDAAADDVMFNYSGRVCVSGQPFTGTGHFKLAIVNVLGNHTLWSNDSSSLNGEEPTAGFTSGVTDGIFEIAVGDPLGGMDPINRTVFNHPGLIKLRVWFSDGTHGFRRLLPDRNLHNVELMALSTGDQDFTIFVNGATGDDDNNGLTTATAKQTIQAAVDVLPARVNCNVTIDIAAGIYREQVNIYGIMVHPEKKVTFLGDPTTTPTIVTDPNVRITACDDDGASVGVRNATVRVEKCSGFTFEGLLFDYALIHSVLLEDCSRFSFKRCAFRNNLTGTYQQSTKSFFFDCVATENLHGFRFWGSYVRMYDSIANQNTGSGIVIEDSHLKLYRATASSNAIAGLNSPRRSFTTFSGPCDFSSNGNWGIFASQNSMLDFEVAGPTYSGTFNFNGRYGIDLRMHSFGVDREGRNSIDATGGLGEFNLETGSDYYQ